MRKIKVNVGTGYDILIERGLLQKCAQYVKAAVPQAATLALVSDDNVAPLYMDCVVNQLKSLGFKVVTYVFKAGESSKNTAQLIKIVEFLAENELKRKDAVVALGGGVCGDMAGFAAAVYLRGIKYIQIPTTLLSQVDSSVGGKTAVDLPQGKNLCGAFHQPALVIIDPDVLSTLPSHYFSDGMGEVIKYGCIKSASLFDAVQNRDAHEYIEDVIYECVDIKRGVVERDEKEAGERALLNFGHTAGHAIEKLHNFTGISHGEAVGIGMVMISKAGESAGITEPGTAEKITAVLKKYNLKTDDENSLSDIISAMAFDKKSTDSGINFIMLSKIGSSFIKPVATADIKKLFGVES